jgi:O-antigen ligase
MLTICVFFLAGPGVSRRLLLAVFAVVPVGAAFLASPFGAKVVDYLPFVGTVDVGSVTYRTRLLELSMEVFWKNPWFGNLTFLRDPVLEELRQGQGIIDITNTYLAYALTYGIVGLLLFVVPFIKELGAVWKTRGMDGPDAAEHEVLGRALVACMIGLLFTLATASMIHLIPGMLYLLLGAMSAYAALRAPTPVFPGRASGR